MVNLSKYIARDGLVRLDVTGHDQIVDLLLHRCLRDCPEGNRERLVEELSQSGCMKDQTIGAGFAITHARLDKVDKIHVAVGLLRRPMHFCKGPPVHTVFCTVIPAGKSGEYLAFMARLSRLLLEPGAEDLFRAGDVDEILKRVAEFET